MDGLDEDRAIADLRSLAQFGKVGTGVNRPALTDADVAAREWLRDRMAEAGLSGTIDGIGNVFGRSPSARVALLAGSHSDSVPNGGWLDGALGVVYALEVARARQATHPHAPIGVDAISFSDEEGTFLACAGSRSFCGALTPSDLRGARNAAGESLGDRLDSLGWTARPLARLEPERHRAFLEAHIEQGPRLIESGRCIGAVTGIVGLRRRRVRFEGRADHAGTTPMTMRRDASMAMHAFALSAAKTLREAGSADSVWNFGVVMVKPGAANVVPDEAEIVVEFRDLSTAVLDRMEEPLNALIARMDGADGVRVTSSMIGRIEPTDMDERLVARIEDAAAREDALSERMQSGAGHDAMIVGRQIPAAMLFVPSIGGRSHHISEDTDERDIRRGLRVYARAAQSILDALTPGGPAAL
jgi:beta-ureidopropionase / N-carbamoyl-L-amino-acid hydrolase